MYRALVATLMTAAVFLCALPAQARPVVKLQLSGSLVERSAKGGEKLVSMEHIVLKSGEIVRYTILASNTGTDPALELTPVGRIPSGTRYIAGSAHGSTSDVEYTLDGKTWSAHPLQSKTQNGKVVHAPADASMFTALRWHMKTALAAHKATSFTYEVRVK